MDIVATQEILVDGRISRICYFAELGGAGKVLAGDELFVVSCEDGFDLEGLEAGLEGPLVGAELEPPGDFGEVEVQVVDGVVEVDADGAFDVGFWEGMGEG
jgi:hypothetical protein